MRARRVRFTTPRIRSAPERVTKTRDGVTVYRRNMQGKQAIAEAIGEQRRRQSGLCAKCGDLLELADSKFESKEFREGVENRLIHKGGCRAITA